MGFSKYLDFFLLKLFFILAFKYGNWESSIFRFGLQNGHVDRYRFHLRIICFYFYSEYTNIRDQNFFSSKFQYFKDWKIIQYFEIHQLWNCYWKTIFEFIFSSSNFYPVYLCPILNCVWRIKQCILKVYWNTIANICVFLIIF
jgi:hypothetical protein